MITSPPVDARVRDSADPAAFTAMMESRVDADGYAPAVSRVIEKQAGAVIFRTPGADLNDSTATFGFDVQAAKLASYKRHCDPTGEVGEAGFRAAKELTFTNKMVDELPLVVGGAMRSAFDLALVAPQALRPDGVAEGADKTDARMGHHALILSDPMISEAPLDIIRSRHYNAEWALVTQIEELSAQFDEIEDPYLRERKVDIQQVAERVLKILLGSEPLPVPVEPDDDEFQAQMVVVAHDISPADMLKFRDRSFIGFVTDVGGQNSHTAIVAPLPPPSPLLAPVSSSGCEPGAPAPAHPAALSYLSPP